MTRRIRSKKALVEDLRWMQVSDLARVYTLTERLTPIGFLRWTFAAALRANWYEVQFVHRKTGVPHRFRIDWTHCRLGGKRPWLICSCGKRVGKLYDGGFCVACRTCLNLRYESQRRGTSGREYLRACRIRMRLGAAPGIVSDFPERPRGMHRRTYERIRREAERLEEPLRRNRHFKWRAPDYSCHSFC